MAAGADYLGLSPIFATATKSDAGRPCGVEAIRAVKARCRLPVAAIGGIDLSNAGRAIAAGADLICAISAVVTAPDPAAVIREFQGLFEDK